MSDNEELDPSLLKSLRDVPVAPDDTRDRHIAAALAEMSPSRRSIGAGRRVLAGVAAAALLTIGTVTFANRGASAPDLASGATSTVAVKGNTDCSQQLASAQNVEDRVTYIAHNGEQYVLVFRGNTIGVYLAAAPCGSVGTIDYSNALLTRGTDVSAPVTKTCENQDVIHQTPVSAEGDNHSIAVLHTEAGISVRFADRCDADLAALALP